MFIDEESSEEKIESKECWECPPGDFPIKASERVDIFTKMSNVLTPYEIMYGDLSSNTRYTYLKED